METTKAVYQMIEGELTRQLFAEATDLVYIFDTQGNILLVSSGRKVWCPCTYS